MSGTNTITERKNVCLKIKIGLIVCVKKTIQEIEILKTKRKLFIYSMKTIDLIE